MNPNLKFNAYIQAAIAGTLLLMLALITFAPIWYTGFKPDADVKQVVLSLATIAVGFYLGSSSSSARKDEQNASLAAQLTAAPAAAPEAPASPTLKGTSP